MVVTAAEKASDWTSSTRPLESSSQHGVPMTNVVKAELFSSSRICDATSTPYLDSLSQSDVEHHAVAKETSSDSRSVSNGVEGNFVRLLLRLAARPDHDDDSDGTHAITNNKRLHSLSSKMSSPPNGRSDPQEQGDSTQQTHLEDNANAPLAAIPDQRKVSFGTISIRDYPICLGDNPGGSLGAPITIEWDYETEASFDFDLYEDQRPQRRTQTEIAMPATVRYELLRRIGYSRQDIQQAEKQANITRSRRRRTVEMLHMAPVHELSEKIVKGTFKALSFRKKKVDEFHFSTTTLYEMEKKQPSAAVRPPAPCKPKGRAIGSLFGSSTLQPRKNLTDAPSRRTSESSLSLDESISGRVRNFGLSTRVDCS